VGEQQHQAAPGLQRPCRRCHSAGSSGSMFWMLRWYSMKIAGPQSILYVRRRIQIWYRPEVYLP
jgi:hypothetical protein